MLIAGLGGFCGTCARYLIGLLVRRYHAAPFPLGTFIVNVVGCFLIGVFYGLAERHGAWRGDLLLLLATGFCGGFTTFSSFADDGYLLLGGRHVTMFVLYVALSLLLGLVMVWAGRAVATGR